jgi:hypothetical protein
MSDVEKQGGGDPPSKVPLGTVRPFNAGTYNPMDNNGVEDSKMVTEKTETET